MTPLPKIIGLGWSSNDLHAKAKDLGSDLTSKILALTSKKEAFFANNRECWVERKAIDLDDAGINGWVIKHLKQYHMQLAGEGKSRHSYRMGRERLGRSSVGKAHLVR